MAEKPGVGALLCVPFVMALAAAAAAQTVIYVDADAAAGANDGSSWADAYTDLQDALSAAISNDEIWVAEGTYRPTTGSDRAISFQLAEGVALYGGLAGTETLRDERDWQAHETILSGDLNGDDGPDFANNGENAYHVVVGASNATLDGFTVANGNADGGGWDSNSGGIYNYDVTGVSVADCKFCGNAADYGGGMHNAYGGAHLVARCTFSGNAAKMYGGGQFNYESSVTLIACTFLENASVDGFCGGGAVSNYKSSVAVADCRFHCNTANGYGGALRNVGDVSTDVVRCLFSGNVAKYGGAVYNSHSSATIANCRFSGNSASWGGGVYNDGGSPLAVNCTFPGNSAQLGGGVYNVSSSPAVSNCVFWSNRAGSGQDVHGSFGSAVVSYSRISDGIFFTDGGGNHDLDPEFVAPGHWDDAGTPGDDSDDVWVDGDYHLRPGSPCIDKADGDAAPALDMDDNPRRDDPGMPNAGRGSPDYADMGAYEFQGRSRITPFGGGCVPSGQNAAALAVCLLVPCLVLAPLRRRTRLDRVRGMR